MSACVFLEFWYGSPHIAEGSCTQASGHVQVDSLGMAYLFFYDKQGHKGLKLEVMENL